MSKSAPAPLTMPTIPRKGEASAAVDSLEQAPLASVELSPPRLSSRVQATIAVTTRLDERRYERMKSWGMARRVTNQEVMVAALDRFFALSDDQREQAIAGLKR